MVGGVNDFYSMTNYIDEMNEVESVEGEDLNQGRMSEVVALASPSCCVQCA